MLAYPHISRKHETIRQTRRQTQTHTQRQMEQEKTHGAARSSQPRSLRVQIRAHAVRQLHGRRSVCATIAAHTT